MLPDGRSISATRSQDGNVTTARHGSVGALPSVGQRFAAWVGFSSSFVVLRGKKTASCGAARRGVPVPSPNWGLIRCTPLPDGIDTSTVALLYCEANVLASSADGSTSVRSHEPRFAVTNPQPSAP